MTGREYNEQFSEEELKTEVWKDIPDWEGYYQVSNLGRVKSLERFRKSSWGSYSLHKERLLKPSEDKDGHFRFSLTKNKKAKCLFIHYLVLLSFIGEKEHKNIICCHNDNNPSNNRLPNLRYDTWKGNQGDRIAFGTHCKGEKCGSNRLTEEQVIEIATCYKNGNITVVALAKKYNVSKSALHHLVDGRSWRYLNLFPKWERKNSHHSNSLFTQEQVDEIRVLYSTGKYTCREIAEIFKTKHYNIWNVISRNVWV